MTYSPDVKTSSFYIHWPFCAYKCHYCPFISFAGQDSLMPQYHHALSNEIKTFAKECLNKQPIDTLYIGGGTPSTCPDALMLDTFDILRSIALFNKTAEITIEINPGAVRREQLELWTSIGINRLSMGVQSLNDKVLKNLNRLHTAKDVYLLVEHAKEHFENVSIDLILGLPGVSNDEWKDLLKTVVNWPISHISIYFLMIHKKTPLFHRIKSGEISIKKDDELVDLYNWSVDYLHDKGFKRYEISNFAREGFESEHNKVYWKRRPYKGFGLAACSFDGSYRFQNHKDLSVYLEKMEKGGNPCDVYEELTDEQVRLEKLMLGLRTDEGVSEEKMFEGLSMGQKDKLNLKIDFLKKNNVLCEKNGRFIISPYFLTVENEIVLELLV